MLKVTDKLVLKRLAEQGINPDHVEFSQDYAKRGKGKSPYMKTYRDVKTDTQVSVISGLPMVDAYGGFNKIEWLGKNGIVENDNNIFHAYIDKTAVRLMVLSDQPDGTKKDTECLYALQVFVGGSKIHPIDVKPKILETDPFNQLQNFNVLEWDYGIIKRRIRQLQGRFRDRHYVLSDPNGDVRIKHNKTGELKLKLGRAVDAKGESLKCFVIGDEEIVPATEFKRPEIVYPVEIGATLTVYPDAHEETSSVDGGLGFDMAAAGEAWATLQAEETATYTGDTDETMAGGYRAGDVSNQWQTVWRGIILQDASALPDGAVISTATESLYGQSMNDDGNTDPDINIYSSAPATPTAIVAGDLDSLGTTPFCDTPIVADSWNIGTPGTSNDFLFNADGLAAISKTIVSKFGIRNANYEVVGSPPTWGSLEYGQIIAWTADKGAGYKPKLVITYKPYPIVVSII